MSTSLECRFIEPEPRKWFYILQRDDCPAATWDWREYADCYGPFASFDAAVDHLHRHHANPGGYIKRDHKTFKTDGVYTRLIAKARKGAN